MKKRMIDFFKGIFVGIGNIAPGLSGGVIAVVLNVYDRLIEGIKDIFTHPIRVIKDIWSLLIGVFLGILIGFLVIVKLVEAFPIPTMMLFIGFIIGPIPTLYNEVKVEKRKIADYLVFFIIIAVIIGLSFIRGESGSYTEVHPIFLFFVGVVAASTMIIPGISGTAILMILGVFTYLVGEINILIDYLLAFDISSIWSTGVGLIPFGLGIIIGGVLLARLVSMLFKKYQTTMRYAVIALLVSCPLSIVATMIADYGVQMKENLIISLIIGVILLVVGTIVSLYMAKLERKDA
ncbi:MAG: DUF368 domain-containing protein [Bacilli bacterium]